ncbi:hypothetical protein BCR41DRAFT_426342 [Lobosporangium transversale]|uniref:F-box domain-containing protein n=1 Tax=Lobosporangium transversale TaxID=64571 RepID=A0A1Y2G797_9FUNG|nr:hypothetical protein BCR41DRAFT_426342 [Lobosporangium transversale]ORY99766.1 hypothetical protein BCR41DRAFT_426342 [Lobosporangium transversale]|eukprot:XP_021876000.1 hypothetical protein BCR41DRAFT_426342 [Lobosporangium transversale]
MISYVVLVSPRPFTMHLSNSFGEGSLSKIVQLLTAVLLRKQCINTRKTLRSLCLNSSYQMSSCQYKDHLRSIECPYCFPHELSQPFNIVMSHSSTITKLSFSSSTLREIWEAILECIHLEDLTLSWVDICDDEVDPFFQVCKKVKHLRMTMVEIDRPPSGFLDDDTDTFILPNVTTLALRDIEISCPPIPYTSPYCIGIWIRRCPKLCSLEFNLRLSTITIKDEEMAALLRQMTDLRRLDAPYCKFGPLCIRELLSYEQEIWINGNRVQKRRLQRLCDTVEALDFNGQSQGTDGVVQAILSNCPRLKYLCGAKITVTEIINGAEWVSTDLTTLVIQLEADVDQETPEGMEKQRFVFRQLGKLIRLRFLSLSNESARTLDMRLRAGLDELANLKNLELFGFEFDHCQNMQIEDATWIVNNWPGIKDLVGLVNQDPDACSLVTDLFRSRGVRVQK